MVQVRLKERSYPVVVGRDVLASLGERCRSADLGSEVFLVCDGVVHKSFGSVVIRSLQRSGLRTGLFVVPPGERSKSFGECRKLLEALAAFDRGKRVFIVAMGGGVTGDLAGFCASVYKRGIPYVQVPTTLLAQVDSAIGGKTAIDLAAGKNLVGAFYQPKLVLSDLRFLESLDRRQFVSGMAEALKYGVICSSRLFEAIEKDADVLTPSSPRMKDIVTSCSRIKADIVSKDERDDRGVRIILNFGHTLGHALEKAAGYGAYTHGEAVSIGMVCACDLSVRLGLLKAAVAERVECALSALGLPVMMRPVTFASLASAYLKDKKFKGTNRFVLLKKIGATQIVEDVPLSLVRDVVKARTGTVQKGTDL